MQKKRCIINIIKKEIIYVKDSYIINCYNKTSKQSYINEYLKKSSQVNMVLDSKKSIFSDDRIAHEESYHTNGNWIWSTDLIYYTKNYNFIWPQDFLSLIERNDVIEIKNEAFQKIEMILRDFLNNNIDDQWNFSVMV